MNGVAGGGNGYVHIYGIRGMNGWVSTWVQARERPPPGQAKCVERCCGGVSKMGFYSLSSYLNGRDAILLIHFSIVGIVPASQRTKEDSLFYLWSL